MTKDLEEEIDLKTQDLEETSTTVRIIQRHTMDLDNERKTLEEDLDEVQEEKEKALNELENKYVSNVEDLQKKHVRALKKVSHQKEAVTQEIEILEISLEEKKKTTTTMTNSTRKLERH